MWETSYAVTGKPRTEPEKASRDSQTVLMIIHVGGKVLDVKQVGDGFFGQCLKEIHQKSGGQYLEEDITHDPFSVGYVTYTLKGENINELRENLKSLMVVMTHLTKDEKFEILEGMDTLRTGDFMPGVQFHGCF